MVKFTIDTVVYGSKDTSTSAFRDSKTLGYIFVNTGNCPVQLNNFLLQPGSVFKTFEPMCKDCTTYRMLFNPFDTCSTDNAELTVLIYNQA
jgi:hypothetical protein